MLTRSFCRRVVFQPRLLALYISPSTTQHYHTSSYRHYTTTTSSPSTSQNIHNPQSAMSEEAKYELLYWPGLPGRGEFVRLALEASKTPYKDTTNSDRSKVPTLVSLIRPSADSKDPPNLCPPILRTPSGLLISQTPNILLYLGDHLSIAPKNDDKYLVHQYALTALDLTNEAHNVHHPVAHMSYYADQKSEAFTASREFRRDRIPKFFGHFDKIVKYNAGKHAGTKYLVGENITYADTTVWQAVDGVTYAFPKRVKELKESGEYDALFKWWEGVKGEEWMVGYVESGRRLKYGDGIFRYYEELDVDE
ncbi:hypothetical protein TWF694_005456 [Orbilia ellipsospora]|uniref:Glutathione S-transferase n=1 Tax=Orbilia ellipsospora TaxID=2528407 RepID=A0AAV9WU93_9PEZI